MLGEFLWQLTAKGQSADLLVPTVGTNATTGGAGPTVDLLAIQRDEIFIPMSWEVLGLPVVGVTRLLWLIIYAVPFDNSTDRIIPIEIFQVQADSATSPSQRLGTSNSQLVIPPAYNIRVSANYDLINAGNFVSGRIYGFRLPKGNLVST